MRFSSFLLLALFSGSGAVWAENGPKDAGSVDLSDHGIDQRCQDMDNAYEILSRQVENDFSDEVDLADDLKNERLSFEKKLLDERRTFLEGLKKKPADKRQAAFLEFWRGQIQQREQFLQRQNKRWKGFNEEQERSLRRDRRNLDNDYDNA